MSTPDGQAPEGYLLVCQNKAVIYRGAYYRVVCLLCGQAGKYGYVDYKSAAEDCVRWAGRPCPHCAPKRELNGEDLY